MRFLSIADIADILGVPLSTVYKWSSAGGDRFPRHIRHGKHVRVRTDWFQQWIDGMVEGGGHDN
jgi:excisionase family DNA binding protein